MPEGPAGLELRLRKRLLEGEAYYGLGQRTGKLERRGRRLSNWTHDDPRFGHDRSHDNLYQAHPVLMAVRPGLSWGLYLHSSFYSHFDIGQMDWETLEIVTHGGELDYYLLTGPTPAEVVEQLTRLTGRPALPPMWALGYHQSRWGYADEGTMRDIVKGFRSRRIPLDVLHFDIDYMDGFRVFTWHPQCFPDPKKLIADLGEEGVKVVTIIDPGVKKDLNADYAVADDGVAQDAFIKNPDGSLFSGYCWPEEALFPDFALEGARSWWGERHRGLVEVGVSGIWNDMNEPSIFACPFKEDAPTPQHPMPLATPQGEGEERTVHAEVHNLYGLLMSQASYEGLTRLRLERRPWVLTRSAYTGIQRYAATWMGDNSSWWEHLELSLTQLMSMGLCGIPYAGVDIGGFFENAHAELYARWIEVGAFYPFMRTHTSAGSREQEPWSFGPEVERIVRGSIELRYRLLPYLYTLAYQAYECGAPLMRPLVYDFPDDAESYHLEDQFMLGPQLLIAPALKPGQTHRLVYLPEGIWNSFLTGKRVPSGYSVTETPLGRAPIFVCGGAVLTLGNVRQSTDEPLRELSLRLYPAAESAWTFIEDDGYSPAPEVARTEVQLIETETAVTARLLPREGDYTPPPRTIYLLLHLSRKPSMVTLDGRPQTAWRWDTEGQAVLLHWEDDGAAHELDVELVD